MTSVFESLGMVHGWLIARQAPPEIMQALADLRPVISVVALAPQKAEETHKPYDVHLVPLCAAVQTKAADSSAEAPACPRANLEPCLSVSALPVEVATQPAQPKESAMPEATPLKRNYKKTTENIAILRSFEGKLTLDEMAARIKRSKPVVWQLCTRHNIPYLPRPKGARKENHWRTNAKAMAEAEAAAALAQSETYTDENGRTVTRCPPRYAHGIGLGRYTAQPTGRHHD
jgi:hypothetical protein